MFSLLLSEDTERGDSEPAIAAGIGEQMLHMSLRPLPRSMRARIRDISGRVPANNAVLIGGGIGHLSAWLLDLFSLEPPSSVGSSKRLTMTIIEMKLAMTSMIPTELRLSNFQSYISHYFYRCCNLRFNKHSKACSSNITCPITYRTVHISCSNWEK